MRYSTSEWEVSSPKSIFFQSRFPGIVPHAKSYIWVLAYIMYTVVKSAFHTKRKIKVIDNLMQVCLLTFLDIWEGFWKTFSLALCQWPLFLGWLLSGREEQEAAVVLFLFTSSGELFGWCSRTYSERGLRPIIVDGTESPFYDFLFLHCVSYWALFHSSNCWQWAGECDHWSFSEESGRVKKIVVAN